MTAEAQLLQQIGRGMQRLSEFSEQELAIATAPKEEIFADRHGEAVSVPPAGREAAVACRC